MKYLSCSNRSQLYTIQHGRVLLWEWQFHTMMHIITRFFCDREADQRYNAVLHLDETSGEIHTRICFSQFLAVYSSLA